MCWAWQPRMPDWSLRPEMRLPSTRCAHSSLSCDHLLSSKSDLWLHCKPGSTPWKGGRTCRQDLLHMECEVYRPSLNKACIELRRKLSTTPSSTRMRSL